MKIQTAPARASASRSIAILLFTCMMSVGAIAQVHHVDRYCKIRVTYIRRNEQDIKVDYGKGDNFSLFNDSTIINGLQGVTLYRNDIDAMNYMSSLGWDLIQVVHMELEFGRDNYICFFRKTFTYIGDLPNPPYK